jgi:ribosomal-protein-alanine N-acetyltransferase
MAEGKLIRYWVFMKEKPDEIVGSFCFQNLLKDPYRSCCLGYKFSRKYLHRGFAYESIQKGIDVVFNEYRMHRIEAYVMLNNEPSLKLIEKLSFQYEGIAFSYAKINGIWSDHKRYSLINPMDLVSYDSEAGNFTTGLWN